MALLSKAQILEADDMETRDIDVPEWGGTVRVTTMSGQARDRYEASLYIDKEAGKANSYDNLRARFLSYCIVNEDGLLLFLPSDLIELGKKNAAVLDKVFVIASELNGTSEDSMEELAKN